METKKNSLGCGIFYQITSTEIEDVIFYFILFFLEKNEDEFRSRQYEILI